MKKVYTFLLVTLFCNLVYGQISINSADLPSANDTFRVSIGQAFTGMDPTLTGAGMTWDYSLLTSTSQRVDSFIDEGATSPLYSFIFLDNSFNPNRANQATRGQGFTLGTVSISDVFNFYYNSSSYYKQVGFGASVNAATIPVVYSPHDVIYNFPVQFGDVDSSNSGYSIDLTSTLGLYYQVARTRHNEVDGWGTLTTPYGTFNTLRVKSTMIERDSVYIDSLGWGINGPPITTIEYKWLGSGQGVPLLQINTGAGGVVTQIVYRDSLPAPVGVTAPTVEGEMRGIYPNPASDKAIVEYDLYKAANVSVDVYSVSGQVVVSNPSSIQEAGRHFFILDLKKQNLQAGTYFVVMTIDGKTSRQSLVVGN